MVTQELVGDLEGQANTEGQVREGEINHEDDRCRLGAGAHDENPQGKDVSNQVDDRDQRVEDRRDDGGLPILKKRQGQQGVVVQVAAWGIPSHGGQELSPPLSSRVIIIVDVVILKRLNSD